MGFVNKPLLQWHGQALLDHVLNSVPQSLPRLISANADIAQYKQRAPVLRDDNCPIKGASGPLVGVLMGLMHCKTDWLLISPGDTPCLPEHWSQALCQQVSPTTPAIVAFDGTRQHHLHLLLHKQCLQSLQNYLGQTGYAAHAWLAEIGAQRALIQGTKAFANFNYPTDLILS